MSTWKKIKNWMADLYYWRTERKLTMEENTQLRGRINELETEMRGVREMNRAMCQEHDRMMGQNPYEEAMAALVKENEELCKLLDGYVEELMHQRDINECLWRDWGAKHSEWAMATKKLQDKDDDEIRLWAEHKLLLASMLTVNPEEGVRFHV